MADYGIAIAQNGFDALSAVVDQTVFDSKTFLFKTVATGSYSFAVGVGGGAVVSSVAHGLSYRPMMMGFWSVDNVSWLPCGYHYTGGNFVYPSGAAFPGNGLTVETYSDATNVYTSVWSTLSSSTTVYVRYIIYIDSIG